MLQRCPRFPERVRQLTVVLGKPVLFPLLCAGNPFFYLSGCLRQLYTYRYSTPVVGFRRRIAPRLERRYYSRAVEP